MAPKVRVNGISPATVVKGSTMFPRDRVKASLTKYNIPFSESASDDELRNALAQFYAERTLTHTPIDPKDCAEAIMFLARLGKVHGSVTPDHLSARTLGAWHGPRGLMRFEGNLLNQDVYLAAARGLEFEIQQQIAHAG